MVMGGQSDTHHRGQRVVRIYVYSTSFRWSRPPLEDYHPSFGGFITFSLRRLLPHYSVAYLFVLVLQELEVLQPSDCAPARVSLLGLGAPA